jgi:hypothetical protein
MEVEPSGRNALSESFFRALNEILTVQPKRRSVVRRGWILALLVDAGLRRYDREDAMPTVIGHHNITKGTKHWLDSPKRKELFGPLGVTNIRTFVDPQNPTRVAVLMDVPDMDAMMKAMQSKAATDAMAFDGVVPESLVILVES